jgi:hypothetical protein
MHRKRLASLIALAILASSGCAPRVSYVESAFAPGPAYGIKPSTLRAGPVQGYSRNVGGREVSSGMAVGARGACYERSAGENRIHLDGVPGLERIRVTDAGDVSFDKP